MNEPTNTIKQKIAADAICHACEDIKNLLLEKNASYGNSAYEPIGVFSKGLSPVQQMDVRIDDKIKRLMQGSEFVGEDTPMDLIGYLILRMGYKYYKKLIEESLSD